MIGVSLLLLAQQPAPQPQQAQPAQPVQQQTEPAQDEIIYRNVYVITSDGKPLDIKHAVIIHSFTSEPVNRIDVKYQGYVIRNIPWEDIVYFFPVLNKVVLKTTQNEQVENRYAARVRGFSDISVYTDTVETITVAGYKVQRRVTLRIPFLNLIAVAFSPEARDAAMKDPLFRKAQLLLGEDFNISPPPVGNWPMFQYNPVHTGGTGDVVPRGELAWKRKVGRVGMNIAIANDTVIVPGGGDVENKVAHVWALDRSSGRFRWKFFGSGADFVSVSVSNGIVYAGSKDNHLYALDLETGKPLWKFPADAPISTVPAVVRGRVVFGTEDFNIYVLDAQTGNLLWKLPTGLFVFSSPISVNERVYIGSNDNFLYCLSLDNGYIYWKFKTSGEIYSSPTYYNGLIYLTSADGTLYAIDAEQGSLLWTFKSTRPFYGSAVAGIDVVRASGNSTEYVAKDAGLGNVYVAGYDGYVYALNAESGQLVWKYKMAFPSEVSPALVGKTLYVPANNFLYALDATTGKEIWSTKYYRLPAKITSAPVVSEGMIYVGCEDGYIYAIK